MLFLPTRCSPITGTPGTGVSSLLGTLPARPAGAVLFGTIAVREPVAAFDRNRNNR